LVYVVFFFQAEDGIRDLVSDWSSDVCSSDLLSRRVSLEPEAAGAAPRGLDSLPGRRPAVLRFLRRDRPAVAARGSLAGHHGGDEIGRASCRERVEMSVVAVSW